VVLPAESGRPIVIRDPHQHIGIRKRGPVSEAGKDEHSSEKVSRRCPTARDQAKLNSD
jgi:hypothetical protein